MAKHDNTAPAKSGDRVARMYPSNSLGKQLRDPKENLSAFTVLKKKFLPNG